MEANSTANVFEMASGLTRGEEFLREVGQLPGLDVDWGQDHARDSLDRFARFFGLVVPVRRIIGHDGV